MIWFKRNLLFSLSLLVVLGLFGYGCFYLYSKWEESSEIQKKVEETDANLKKIFDAKDVFPSATNIAVLRQQEADLKSFLGEAAKTKIRVEFDARISPSGFKTLLDNSLAELNKDAEHARIAVAQRDFTFSAIKPLVSFPEGSVTLLAEQLAELKVICSILFRSEVSSLDNIRRVAVCRTDIDAAGSSDYHTLPGRTNESTGDITSYYLVTFQSFSESLASVLENVQKSPYGLSVRLLSVLPGVPAKPGSVAQAIASTPSPSVPFARAAPVQGGRAAPGQPAAQAAGRRLETLADEKSFRVAVMLELSKPGASSK